MDNPKVSIVIVTWNSEKDIPDCLDSLTKLDYENIPSVFVVDSASTDKTVEIIKEKYPWVDLIESEENLYFGGGNNLGIATAMEKDKSEYVAILNPDTKVEADWISKSVEAIQQSKRVGIVGPKIKFLGGENDGLLNSAGMIFDGFMQAYDRGFKSKDEGQFDHIEEAPAISGTAMLIDTKMIEEIGGFWEKLKMYIEDVEFCIRARKAGWKLVYTGETTVHHKYMQSTNANKQLNIEKTKMLNWVYIAFRHYPLFSKFAVLKEYILFKVGKK